MPHTSLYTAVSVKPRYIDRLISRCAQLLFLCLLTSFGVSKLLALPQSDRLNLTLTKLARNPYDLPEHVHLALLYAGSTSHDLARYELQIAEHLQTSFVTPVDNVLEETTQLFQTRDLLETQPLKRKQIFEYWQKIAIDHPLYRDGWVQLMYLAYNEGNIKEAKLYLNKIRDLDPNYIEMLPEVVKNL